jgi:hypothetical protein
MCVCVGVCACVTTSWCDQNTHPKLSSRRAQCRVRHRTAPPGDISMVTSSRTLRNCPAFVGVADGTKAAGKLYLVDSDGDTCAPPRCAPTHAAAVGAQHVVALRGVTC